MDTKETIYPCVGCAGVGIKSLIIERSYIPYKPAVSGELIGPGSENIATEEDRVVDGYHCHNCGMEYHKEPNSIGAHATIKRLDAVLEGGYKT